MDETVLAAASSAAAIASIAAEGHTMIDLAEVVESDIINDFLIKEVVAQNAVNEKYFVSFVPVGGDKIEISFKEMSNNLITSGTVDISLLRTVLANHGGDSLQDAIKKIFDGARPGSEPILLSVN